MSTRAEYALGLRIIAEAVEADAALEIPWTGGEFSPFAIFADSRDEMAAWARWLDDGAKEIGIRPGGEYYKITGHIGGVRVELNVPAFKVGNPVTREQTVFEVEPFLAAASS